MDDNAVYRPTKPIGNPHPQGGGTLRLLLTQSFPYYCFINAPTRAASSQLAVYHNSREAAHAILLRAVCNVFLMHVMNHNLMFGPCQFADSFDGVLTGFATGA